MKHLLLLTICGYLCLGGRAQVPQEIGVDRTLLSALPADVQEKTLTDIDSLGATWFRDGPSSGSPRGIANYVGLVRRARQHHQKVLMIISMMDEDYDHPDSLRNNGYGWKEKKLSRINRGIRDRI